MSAVGEIDPLVAGILDIACGPQDRNRKVVFSHNKDYANGLKHVQSTPFHGANAKPMEDDVPAWWPMSGLDLVPDAETALKLGKIILERYYGDNLVRSYEPYRAIPDPSDEGEWLILGSHPDESGGGLVLGGGFPELSIARKDARVMRIALSR